MSALPDRAAMTSETPPCKSSGPQAMRRALVVAASGAFRPVVAFWASRWWLLALIAPALIALKVFLFMAGVPWWLIAVIAAALIAVKILLISWHARRAAPQGRRLDT